MISSKTNEEGNEEGVITALIGPIAISGAMVGPSYTSIGAFIANSCTIVCNVT